MTPFRPSASRVLLVALLSALLSAGALAQASSTITLPRLSDDPTTHSGFQHYYSLEYDQALSDFEKVLKAHPDDPIAMNHVLAVLIFRELYRAGAFETSLYATNDFAVKKQVKVPAETAARIRDLTDRALRASDQRLESSPDDIDTLYARGVTRGLRATYLGLVDKAWFSALRAAIGARHDHERVLELDPKFADAKTVLGVHNYVAGSLPFAVKVAVSLVGLSGSKSKGLAYLYEASNANGETAPDARVALVLFLRREQRYDEALKLARALTAEYPKNFLFATEEGNILNASGHGPEAIASLRQVIENGKKGKYPDPHLEVPYFALGEALKGQRHFADAADAYEQVPNYPRVDTDLRQRAHLFAGEMSDAAGQRDRATRDYQAAVNDDPASASAQLARKYLKTPFHP